MCCRAFWAILIIAIPGFLLVSLDSAQADCDGTCIFLSKDEVAAAAYGNGERFRGGALVYSIAIANAESTFALNAINHNSPTSIDYGLWQINTHFHPEHLGHENDLLYDASYNARAAYSTFSNTFGGPSFCEWAAFWQGKFEGWLRNVARLAAQTIDSTVIRPINEEISRVTATSDVNVRTTYDGGSLLRTVTAGTTGKVLDGPQVQSFGTCPGTTHPHYYIWWKIHWDDGGADGWSVEDAMARISASTASCATFSSGSTIPSGFGVPWDVFNTSVVLLQASCNFVSIPLALTATAKVGPAMYVYNQGYAFVNNQWQQITFSCTGGTLVSNAWCPNSASVPLPNNSTYYAAYTCNFVNNQWKCGCRDQACTQNLWQLQKIN